MSYPALSRVRVATDSFYSRFLFLFLYLSLSLSPSLFTHQGRIPCAGVVNALEFDPEMRFLVAGVGREHRLGRWFEPVRCRDGVRLFFLQGQEK